jgi:hypothetical protein
MYRGDPAALEPPAQRRIAAEFFRELLPHITRGLFSEGDGEDAKGVDALRHQAREVLDQNRGFARAGASHDARVEGPLRHLHGRLLIGGIENGAHPSSPAASASRAETRQTSR